MPPVTTKKYVLALGENTFAGPASTNIADARKLQSLVPSLSGSLDREHQLIPFTADAAFPSRIGFFHQFKRNNAGVITTYWFCATATTLYQLSAYPGGVWNSVAAVGALAAFPIAKNINNLLHLSDGVSSFIFDGANWVKEGLAIPPAAPSIVTTNTVAAAIAITSIARVNGVVTVNSAGIPSAGSSMYVVIAGVGSGFDGTFFLTGSTSMVFPPFTYAQTGFPDVALGAGGTMRELGFSPLSNKYYWTTFSDQSSTHPHESSSSPRSVGTGVLANGKVQISQRPGTASFTAGLTTVVGSGTDFSQRDVGMLMKYNGGLATTSAIASVQDAQHLTLTTVATVTLGAQTILIYPSRMTHWNIYCSATEEDKVGQFLVSKTISSGGLFAIDQSPFIGTSGSYVGATLRPLLNDPPNATLIMEQHKYRLWRRLESFQNYFTYSAFEEVLAEQAGVPQECVPGIDANTVSPAQVNSTSYPDQSSQIRGLCSHGDALYVGTEGNVIPLYGSSLADFALSQAQAFAVGFAGTRAVCSTPFGLAFLSYDLKVYLYPSQYSFGIDSTTALIELGRPKRPEFETIKGSDLSNVHLVFYNWGRRNWLVMSYQKADGTFGTWVFDFEVKGWFQLQQGYTALAVFEMTPGLKTLVGAGADFKTYVIDDLTGNYVANPATNYPVGTYRELLDFGDPDSTYVIKSVGFETSNANLTVNVTIWLDPIDPENPGVGIPIVLSNGRLGANSFNGRPNASTGAACERVLVEFSIPASTVSGRFHGFTVEAEKIIPPVL